MSHEVFEEHIASYAAGALERPERQAIEAHLLTGCQVCHAALKEARKVAGLLPYSLPLQSAPARLKASLMRSLAQESSPQPSLVPQSKPTLEPGGWVKHLLPPPPTWRTHPAVAALLLVLLAGTAFYALSVQHQAATAVEERQRIETALHMESGRIEMLQGQLMEQERLLTDMQEEFNRGAGNLGELKDLLVRQEAEVTHLRAQVASREQETAGLRKALAQRDEMLAFLRSPNVKAVSLAGSAMAKSAGALLLYDPDTKKAFLYAFNLPALPAGKTYQLWAIVDKPVSAGIFSTDTGHKSRFIIRSMPDPTTITKFAVSLEPEGGRPQPTGEIYLLGQL
ncbi:MAG: hypothetical protein EPO61_13825 [Nitrospirae bacterium]|nr:MAG: hypothetical protein EPO61_13825 [Nitrospirota bacterium]